MNDYREVYRWVEDCERLMQYTDEYVVEKVIGFGIEAVGIDATHIHDVYNALGYLLYEEPVVYIEQDSDQFRMFRDMMNKTRVHDIPQESLWGKVAFIVAIMMKEGMIAHYGKKGEYHEGVDTPPDPGVVNHAITMLEDFELDDPGDAWLVKTAGMDIESNVHFAQTITPHARRLIDAINVVGELDYSAHGGARLRRSYEVDNNGDRVRFEQIEDPTQILGVSAIDLIREDFDEAVLRGEIYRPRRYAMSEERARQLIIMLVDDSGSMSDQWKVDMLRAVLLDVGRKVVRRDAIVYLATFETNLDAFTMLEDEVDVDYAVSSFFGLNRGWTNIEQVIRQCSRQIAKGKLKGEDVVYDFDGIDPQILIVNDGDDPIDASYDAPLPVHAITLGNYNAGLQEVCMRSGGQYTRIKR